MKWRVALVLGLLAGAALLLRWPGLDQRPMHNDEAVNAVKFGRLWTDGFYRYDHNEHHGPTLYYATAALARLSAAPDYPRFTETRLRLVTVLFGAGLVLILPLLCDGLGRKGVIWAGVLTVVSPAIGFYSRYYIHEILLVFFATLALAAGWRYWRSRKLPWALLTGAALGLMHATKETFVITVGSAALALFINHAWNRALDASGAPVRAPALNWKHLTAAGAVWIAVALLIFSSFLTNASGPLDSIRTYFPWLQRAGGDSPHIHPWSFYFQRLLFFHPGKGPVWTEGFILFLSLIGAAAGFRRQGLEDASASLVRFLAVFALLQAAIYSLLPYKTPWCLLNFWHPAVLLAGVGAATLLARLGTMSPFRRRSLRIVVACALLLGVGHLAWQSWQLDHAYAADRRNPHVYGHTSPDVLNLVRKMEQLADAHPQGRSLLVKVMAANDDYWPLPYYFRSFDSVGWWDAIQPDPYAPVMVVSSRFHAALDEKKTHLMVGYFQLRPDAFLELYVELDLWQAYLRKHPPAPDPADS